ncbi:MAG: response regulator [Saprospiraceae bacterium]
MKILVVDDEKDVKVLFEQRFRREVKNGEMEFVFAFSGEEAIEILKNLKHEAILILSDINMPGMSGLDLLNHIKNKYVKPPPVVMMITAYGDEENYNTAKRLGADDFLTKPLDFKLLKEKLKTMMDGKDFSSR